VSDIFPTDLTTEIVPDDDTPIALPSNASPLLAPPDARTIRDELQKMIFNDLLGPAGGAEEEIGDEADNVRDRYILGVLAPRYRAAKEEGETDDSGIAVASGDTSEESPDTGAPQRGTMFPSSVGMSFHVAPDANHFLLSVSWGRYVRVPSEKLTNDKGEPRLVWKRIPVSATKAVPLTKGLTADWSPCEDCPEVQVRGLIRRKDGDPDFTVTLFLVNNQKEKAQTRDDSWLFQCHLSVEAPGKAPIFIKREMHRKRNKLDSEIYREMKTLEMQYRCTAEFAVGHGIAVRAERDDNDALRACRLQTDALPTVEVPSIDPAKLADLTLDMKELARTADADLPNVLSPLTDAYSAWIETEKARLASGADYLGAYNDTSTDNIGGRAMENCEVACTRIRAGIALLASDPDAADAFRFANQAMWLQRIHALYAEKQRNGDTTVTKKDLDIPDNRTWRPFQLAFILLNLPGITQLDHVERKPSPHDAIADLLWFPTGGGKTEAYLGLTAYTLAIRRLQGTVAGRVGEAGVAVLMRYTLRLLTLQQFQRAAALMCACESIRREALAKGNPKWGKFPFRIGLWVGNKTTPNTTAQSDEAVKARRNNKYGGVAGSGDPAQLTFCPWCGSEIQPGRHIEVNLHRKRTLVYCGDPLGKCLYSKAQSPGEGLPIVVVDEEIYRLLPSLLIATVDKFAQMPWNGVVETLFGHVTGWCERHGFRSPDLEDTDSHPAQGGLPAARTIPHAPLRPPDLIIQDELHLISGPLGSLVGLYETAVDYLGTWEVNGNPVRPKVIASTATIRNALTQVHKTFNRRVHVFPPQGLDAEDNFFARQSDIANRPGRLYVGVCAPGRRLKSVLIRVYLAYLAAGQTLYETYGKAADPYMTLVGYFNSMRELGGMRRLVEDDIRAGLNHVDRRGLKKRRLRPVQELTSRMPSTDIPKILDKLEQAHVPDGTGKSFPIDVLLATNMISVGVDVKRLGLMVVANQPKSTAEYIQATSRVGRTYPGIVCTVLNWARPRDLSHYERFEHYHLTYYQYVEALSVTPFAPRALDRGLSALLVSCARLSERKFNANADAKNIQTQDPELGIIRDAIARRASEVEGVEVGEHVRESIMARMDIWASRAQRMTGGAALGYQTRNDGKTFGLLQKPGSEPWQEFTCLNSLRDVEPMVNLILDNYGMDDVTDGATQTQQPIQPVAAAPAAEEDELTL